MRLGLVVLTVAVWAGMIVSVAAGAGTVSQMASEAADTQPAVAVERFIPVAYCPKTTEPPKIDGVLDDACWKDAGVIGDFVSDKKDVFPTQQTQVRVIRDDKWIYFGIRCSEVDMAHQKVFRTGRGMPWDDDSVELFVDAKRGDSEYQQLCANVLGANNLPLPKDDDKAVVVAGKALDNAWIVEARLLIEGVAEKAPVDGDVWGLNVNRNRNREKGTEYSNWSRLKGSSHFSDLFGLLVFCQKVPAVRVTNVQLGDRFEGGNIALVRLVADQAGQVRVSFGAGEKRQERSVSLAAGVEGQVGVPYTLEAGRNAMDMVVRQDDPLLKATFYAAAVDRPEWARYVKGVGAFALQAPFDAIVQGEETGLAVKAAWDGAQRSDSKVEWGLLIRGRESSSPALRGPKIEKDQPDGLAVLEARVCDGPDREVVTLRREVQLAGQRLEKWTQLAGAYKKRAEKLLAESKADPMRLYAQKTVSKVARLEAMLGLRDLAGAGGAVEEIGYQLDCLEKGKMPVWGHHELVYTSQIDHTEQPFFVTVPKEYQADGKDRRPVVIWLHPFWGDGAWPRDRVVEYMGNMERACLAKGFLLVHPYGRGSQGYYADGEADVWDVWRIVNERWRVDPERVYLAGFSMGGSGTSHWCAWYPELFAAGAAYSGSLRGELVDNLRYIPMRFELGGQEPSAPRVQEIAEKVKAVPGRTTETIYVAHPNEGHTEQYIDWPALLKWFSQYKRVQDPVVVTVGANELAHASGYWVSIEGFEECGRPARAEARVKDGAVEVTTQNVAEMVLTPPAKLVDRSKALRVKVNGKDVTVPFEKDGLVRLVCTTQPAAVEHGIRKTKALAGPIPDAYRGPLMMVTTGEGEACIQGAEMFAKRWQRWHHGELQAVAEGKAKVEDLADHNIILVGQWDADGLMKRVRESAPVAIDEKGIAVAGKRREGSGLGIVFLQPNPLNPQRYVVVVTGQDEKGLLEACRMMEQEQYRGDYAVTDKGPGGVFDMQWK